MFDYNNYGTRLTLYSPAVDAWGDRPRLSIDCVNLIADCSTVSLGNISCNANSNESREAMFNCLLHYLCKQRAALHSPEKYTWKLITTCAEYDMEMGVYKGFYKLLSNASNNVHINEVKSWKGYEDFKITVYEVSKNYNSVPDFNLPDNYKDFYVEETLSPTMPTTTFGSVRIAKVEEKDLEEYYETLEDWDEDERPEVYEDEEEWD